MLDVSRVIPCSQQLSVEREVSLGGAESFAVDVLIGRRDEEVLDLCARRVAASMAGAGCTKSLLLAVALRSHSLDVIRPILEAIELHKVW
jgi:Proteasome assembly chaperone 3